MDCNFSTIEWIILFNSYNCVITSVIIFSKLDKIIVNFSAC